MGSALTAVANRLFADDMGGTLVLRIDDTDETRVDPEAEARIRDDLEWLGIRWDEGPVRQSERRERHLEAAGEIGTADAEGALRFGRTTLVRADGRPTYHLASVVDDVDLGVTHVIRGKDHLPNAKLHAELTRALGAEPPDYVHHGLLVGTDGTKLSKRHGAASLADLREQGIPPEAVRRYLEELGLPRGDVHFDEKRLRRLAVEAIASLSDEELAGRAGAPVSAVSALRGARTLAEARTLAAALATPPSTPPTTSPETLRRFRDLRETANGELDEQKARALVDELRSGGADLHALRVALTGAERGPELWTIILALPAEEALQRVDAAL